MSVEISAVICTYNRADLLPGAIESLCQQNLEAARFEVLVVDNASTDTTARVIEEQQGMFPRHQIRRIVEEKRGLGYARNTGLQQAAGRYIAYMDDDARALEDWLGNALSLFDRPDPPLCVGGPCFPFYTSPKPAWFKDSYEIRTWGDTPRRLQYGDAFSGSNMIWCREALESAGGFGENVGVSGQNLSIGEETTAFKSLWKRDPESLFCYSPELVILHWVPYFKMRVAYLLKRAFVNGQVMVQLDPPSGLRERLAAFVRSSGAMVIRSLEAVRRIRRHRFWQNWVVEEGRPVVVKAGAALAALNIMLSFEQR